MKLLFCPVCHDAQELLETRWRRCVCGFSGGQYNSDGMTATIGGQGRVFGVGNIFFDALYTCLTEEKKAELRTKYYKQPTDAWWGEYPGDVQIFRIENSKGPRLEVKVKRKDVQQNMVVVVDKRFFSIDGKNYGPNSQKVSVIVPRNLQWKIARG